MLMSQATATYKFHLLVAAAAICSSNVAFMIFSPFGADSFEAVAFLGMSVVTFLIGVDRQTLFTGYGVAKEIKDILHGSEIVHDFGGLILKGFAIKPLVMSWLIPLLEYTATAAATILLYRTTRLVSAEILSLVLVLCAGRLLALLSEMYVWFAANRRRLWYLPEPYLDKVLHAFYSPEDVVQAMMQRAKERDLLLR